MLSTSEGYHDACGEDIMIHVGGYHEYIGDVQKKGGCSVHRGDTMSTSGDV